MNQRYNNLRLQLYISTHNRPDYVLKCVNAAREQINLNDVQIIVSDNSSNNETELLLKNCFKDVMYIKRNPMLRPIEHLNKILQEANGEYLTVFHDDDILFPNYVEVMRSALNNNPEFCAAACNAYYMNNNLLTNETIWKNKLDRVIEDGTQLTKEYIVITSSNPPPLSGYMYRISKIRGITIEESDAGKYSDLAFLIKLANQAKILWISAPLMAYRLHSNNDTKNEEITQRLMLARFIYKNTNIRRKSFTDIEMRYIDWYRWRNNTIIQSKQVNHRKRVKTITKFLIISWFIHISMKKNFWLKLYNKIVRNAIA